MAKGKGQGNKPADKKPDAKKPEGDKSAEEKSADKTDDMISKWEKAGQDNGTKEYKAVYPKIRMGGFYILHVITAIWLVYIAYNLVQEYNQQQESPETQPEERSVPSWTSTSHSFPSLASSSWRSSSAGL